MAIFYPQKYRSGCRSSTCRESLDPMQLPEMIKDKKDNGDDPVNLLLLGFWIQDEEEESGVRLSTMILGEARDPSLHFHPIRKLISFQKDNASQTSRPLKDFQKIWHFPLIEFVNEGTDSLWSDFSVRLR